MKTQTLKPILAVILTLTLILNPYTGFASLTPEPGDGWVPSAAEIARAQAEQEITAAEAADEPGETSQAESAAPGETDEEQADEVATPGVTEPELPVYVPVAPQSQVMALAAPVGTTAMTAAEMNALFTYTGSYEGYWYYDGGTRKWFVMFLSNGTFTPKNSMKADVFLVGGGGSGAYMGINSIGAGVAYLGGGGGGGYANTVSGISCPENQGISVTIGGGGAASNWTSGNAGTASYFGSYSAAGGGGAFDSGVSGYLRANGGHGGSGGGAGKYKTWGDQNSVGGTGGSNGNNGGDTGYLGMGGSSGDINGYGGNGQGTSTYAFSGDKSPFNAMLFAGGGGGGGGTAPGTGGSGGGGNGGSNGTPNTGGGGGGGSSTAGAGGSGIVIIRNINSPPTSVGTITVPASVNMWTTSNKVTASWVAATDPDGDTITYTVEYAVNGSSTYTVAGTTISTSYALDLSASKPSSVKFRITPSDPMGNVGPAAEASSWTACVYNTPPTTPTNMVNVSAVNSWQSTAITFTWTASTDVNTGAGQTVTYQVEESVNGGAWTSVQSGTSTTFTHNVSIPSHTSVQLRVRAYDGYDYSTAYLTSSTVIITHDLAAPTIQITAVPDAANVWANTEVTITVVLSDAVSGLKSLTVPAGLTPVGDQILSGTSATKTFKTSANGTYSFTVTDNAGNTASASAALSKIDMVAPTIQVTAAPDASNIWTNSEVTITVTVSDAASGLKSLTVPSGLTPAGDQTLSGASTSKTFKTTANGTYSFTVTDNAGNTASASVALSKIDMVDPSIQVVSVPDASNTWVKDEVTITVIVSDAVSGLKSLTVPAGVTPAGNQTLSGTGETKTFKTSVNGSYSFTVTDNAGNSASASVSPSKIDADNPVITYTTAPAAGEFINGDATITLNMSDNSSGLSSFMSLNGQESVSGKTAQKVFTAVSNGVYPFSVTDIVGHNTAISVVIDMIDRIKPAASIVPRVKQWTNATSVMLDITGTDDYSGVAGLTLPSGYVDGAAATYEIFNNGEYTATATDRATNVSEVATLNYTWFDRTSPTVRFVKFVAADNPVISWLADILGIVTNKNVKIEVTGDDVPETGEGESGVNSFVYRVLDQDNNVVQDWTSSPVSTSPVIDYDVNGHVELYVRDAAGNDSGAEAYKIIIDTKNPQVEVIYSTTETTNDPVEVSLRILADGGSGAKGFVLPEGGVLVHGAELTYTFTDNAIKTFTAYNNAGNSTEVEVRVANIEAPKVPVELWENNKPVIYAILHATGRRYIEDVTYPDLYNIKYIDLSANGMDSIPDVFGELKNLEHLDIRGNVFDDVPACVYRLTNLRYLDLSNNNLSDVGGGVSALRKLDTLDVSLNYLIDYDCPLIVPDYRDAGNFTVSSRPDAYSFRILDPDAQKEYVGNTAVFKVAWSYGGEDVSGSLEAHRKALFSTMYPLYRSYRSLVYRYETESGQIKASTADYAMVYLPDSGTTSIRLRLGSVNTASPDAEEPAADNGEDTDSQGDEDEQGQQEDTAVEAYNAVETGLKRNDSKLMYEFVPTGISRLAAAKKSGQLEAVSQGVDVLDLPEPKITKVNEETKTIYLTVAVDPDARADFRASVILEDNGGDILEISPKVVVNDPGNITIPLKADIMPGYILTPEISNNDMISYGEGDMHIEAPKVPVELWEENKPVVDAVLHATGRRYVKDVTYADLLKITYIDLSAKSLDSIPDILGEVKNLEHLDLRGNEFSEIPACVYRLNNLSYLDLSNNNLSAIGEGISALRKLDALDVSLNYLVDYDCPLIVPNYRDAGNFTVSGRPDAYSFRLVEPDAQKEYVGNTATFKVSWSYGGKGLVSSLEAHRKALFSTMYPLYRSYRPLVYRYETESGQIKASTADYAMVYLPDSGTTSVRLRLGSGKATSPDAEESAAGQGEEDEQGQQEDTAVDSYNAVETGLKRNDNRLMYEFVPTGISRLAAIKKSSQLEAVSQGVDVLALPEPKITKVNEDTNIIHLTVAVDPEARADFRASVILEDNGGDILEISPKVVVNDPDNITIPLKANIMPGYILTPEISNNDMISYGESDVHIEAPKVPVELWEENLPVVDAVLHATRRRYIKDVTYADLLKITYIDLSAKGLDSIPDILGEVKNLEHLDFRGNEFSEIPACVYRLNNLNYLDLSNNNLSEIGGGISALRKLDTLDVSLNYLVDYDCPLIVPDYRDAGNFTVSGRPDAYSFRILDPDAQKEYVGNTAVFKVAWSYDGEDVSGSLEAHRKSLFSVMYPLYRSYRPLVYRFEAAGGQVRAGTPDYVQVYLPDSGAVAVMLELG